MAKVLSTQEIRDSFQQFFVDRDHRRVPSSPLVPADDPSLLFTSAGMVQFKPFFAAKGSLEYTRATSVQKCFRATDLEQVGHTPRHLTFFEMLGNFSFGDYFKREAIHWAWEYCTKVLEMDTDRLWVTVYLDDDEASDIWTKEVGVAADRVVRLGKDDNFWGPAGATGACGPCSEIYMDLGEAFGGPGQNRPGDEGDRFQEFWNLVFPQFFQDADGGLSPLPRPGIDTGMGLERLAQLLQGVDSVFETDGFRPLRDAALDLAEFDLDREEDRQALHVVIEHARAVTMLFHEGIYPSNDGRGYVARRILRRAVRRGRMQGLHEPFLYKLTGVAVDTLIQAYPDLKESRERIAQVCKDEESRFLITLENGLRRFEEVVGKTGSRGETVLRGEDAFTLYDTFGFPIDMTAEMARERGLTLDEDGFRKAMARQVERSRSAGKFDEDSAKDPWTWTDGDHVDHSEYVGYDTLELDVKVVARRRHGDVWEFLLERTPFYAEGGGQVADRGRLLGEGFELEVVDVQKHGALHLHRGKVTAGGDLEGAVYRAEVDAEARRSTERNHTATHLLNAALRRVLGDHVSQAGSLVAPDRLRFDFHHFSGMTPDQIQAVEDDVNRAVLADFSVHKEITSMDEARASGAVAMFGEKYGDEVRQVYVLGEHTTEVTRELCGGCHVRRTGEIGLFRITAEESVAAGIRRVEAVTGWNAVLYSRDQHATIERVGDLVRASSSREVEVKVRTLAEENDRLRKELSRAQSETLSQAAGELIDRVQTIRGVSFLAAEVPADGVDALREAADKLRDRMGSGAGVLAARVGEKAAFLAFVTDDVVESKGLRADQLVKAVAKIAGGGGGGRPTLATAGAKNPDKIGDALDEAVRLVESMLAADTTPA